MFCKFGLDCTYARIENYNSKLETTVIHHIANMKANLIELKEVIQTVNEIEHLKQELKKNLKLKTLKLLIKPTF